VGIPGHIALIMAAGILAYLITATAALAVYWRSKLLRSNWAPTSTPVAGAALNAAGNVLMAAPFVVMGYGAMVERLDFQWGTGRAAARLPLDLDGLRILQLSDIHLSAFLHESDLARVIDMPSICTRTSPWSRDLISSPRPLGCLHTPARPRQERRRHVRLHGHHEHYAGVERYTRKRARAPEFVFCAVKRKHCARKLSPQPGWRGLSIPGRQSHYRAEPGAWSSPAPRTCCSRTIPTCSRGGRQGYNLLLAGTRMADRSRSKSGSIHQSRALLYSLCLRDLPRRPFGGVRHARHRNHRHPGPYRSAPGNLRLRLRKACPTPCAISS